MKTIDYTRFKSESRRRPQTTFNIYMIVVLALVVKMAVLVIVGE